MRKLLAENKVDLKYVDTSSNLFTDILLWVLPLLLIFGL